MKIVFPMKNGWHSKKNNIANAILKKPLQSVAKVCKNDIIKSKRLTWCEQVGHLCKISNFEE